MKSVSIDYSFICHEKCMYTVSAYCIVYSIRVHRGAEAGGILGVNTPHFWRDFLGCKKIFRGGNFRGVKKFFRGVNEGKNGGLSKKKVIKKFREME